MTHILVEAYIYIRVSIYVSSTIKELLIIQATAFYLNTNLQNMLQILVWWQNGKMATTIQELYKKLRDPGTCRSKKKKTVHLVYY